MNADIAQVIQLSVAPVFLLTAIAGFLGVLTTRLGRVIDRVRDLEAHLPEPDSAARARAIVELGVLDRRITLANRAIILCTLAALGTALLIAALFLADLAALAVARLVAALFLVVLALLTGGLLSFLAEIRHAMASLRVNAELIVAAERPHGRWF